MVQDKWCRVNDAEDAIPCDACLSCRRSSEALVTSIKKAPFSVCINTRKFKAGMQYRSKKFYRNEAVSNNRTLIFKRSTV